MLEVLPWLMLAYILFRGFYAFFVWALDQLFFG